jgi:sulfoacetaldehyde dehydrogenase
MLAESADVARVIVNQPQGTAEAGSFTNALPATMVLGCGTWAGNTVSGNVTYEHFLNYTHVAEPLPERVPTQDELWGDYLRRYH